MISPPKNTTALTALYKTTMVKNEVLFRTYYVFLPLMPLNGQIIASVLINIEQLNQSEGNGKHSSSQPYDTITARVEELVTT